MQITLNHEEIVDALIKSITNQGIVNDDTEMKVTMVAGRGATGHSAVVDIVKKGTVQTVLEVKKAEKPAETIKVKTTPEKTTPEKTTPENVEGEEAREATVTTDEAALFG